MAHGASVSQVPQRTALRRRGAPCPADQPACHRAAACGYPTARSSLQALCSPVPPLSLFFRNVLIADILNTHLERAGQAARLHPDSKVSFLSVQNCSITIGKPFSEFWLIERQWYLARCMDNALYFRRCMRLYSCCPFPTAHFRPFTSAGPPGKSLTRRAARPSQGASRGAGGLCALRTQGRGDAAAVLLRRAQPLGMLPQGRQVR